MKITFDLTVEELKEIMKIDFDEVEQTEEETEELERPYVSNYARWFDEGCTGWTKSPEYNLLFLKRQQDYANDLLKRRGHVFLNEIYDMLGIPRTAAGQVVGWVYQEKHPIGDNFIDFGIYNIDNTGFVNGKTDKILLDFNVDGNIMGLI